MKYDDTFIEEQASDLLDFMANNLPDVEDEGILGELILVTALNTYRLINELNPIKEEKT